MSPLANLFKSASLNTDRDRRSLIGSALTETSGPSKLVAAAITVQNKLRLAPRRPMGRFTVLKVPNRTLLRSERQGGLSVQRSAFGVRRAMAQETRVQRRRPNSFAVDDTFSSCRIRLESTPKTGRPKRHIFFELQKVQNSKTGRPWIKFYSTFGTFVGN